MPVGSKVNVLHQLWRQLPEAVFLHDEGFSQRSRIRHIIVAYLVFMADETSIFWNHYAYISFVSLPTGVPAISCIMRHRTLISYKGISGFKTKGCS